MVKGLRGFYVYSIFEHQQYNLYTFSLFLIVTVAFHWRGFQWCFMQDCDWRVCQTENQWDPEFHFFLMCRLVPLLSLAAIDTDLYPKFYINGHQQQQSDIYTYYYSTLCDMALNNFLAYQKWKHIKNLIGWGVFLLLSLSGLTNSLSDMWFATNVSCRN